MKTYTVPVEGLSALRAVTVIDLSDAAERVASECAACDAEAGPGHASSRGLSSAIDVLSDAAGRLAAIDAAWEAGATFSLSLPAQDMEALRERIAEWSVEGGLSTAADIASGDCTHVVADAVEILRTRLAEIHAGVAALDAIGWPQRLRVQRLRAERAATLKVA